MQMALWESFVGGQPYEQITVFLLDCPDAVPQPREEFEHPDFASL